MRLIRLLLAAPFLACQPVAPEEETLLSPEDVQAIRSLESAYADAWLRDDTTAVLATLDTAPVLQPAGQRPLVGLEAVRRFWWPGDGSETRILSYETSVDEVGGGGSWAFSRGTGVLTFTWRREGPPQTISSRSMSLTVYRRNSVGDWRIARRMWGPLAVE